MKRLLAIKSYVVLLLCVLALNALERTRGQENADATSAKYSVDFTEKIGKIKPLNGTNLWADLHVSRNATGQQPEAVACRFSTVRLHDAPLVSAGMRIVDVQHIFGVDDADPKDPKNYYFDQTDDYIERIIDGGSTPIYRLGTSIEHSEKSYYAKKPRDPEHFAEVCAGIVRHYVAGWANGKTWNMPYWEIWNEPDLVPQMWDDRNWNSYVEFYLVVAKRLRAEFKDIKIGGPALTNANLDKIKELAQRCKEEDAPLDFVSWHCYPQTPEQLIEPVYAVRKLLDDLGFQKTELHLNEWHYLPCGWKGIQGDLEDKIYWLTSPEGLHGYVSAAFNDFVLTRWQDAPLDMSNHYGYSMKNWGLFEPYGGRRITYYSFLLFGELAHDAPYRVKTQDENGSVALLAGVDESGSQKKLLVSIFKDSGKRPIVIKVAGAPESGTVRVAQIDFQTGFSESELEYSGGVVQLPPKDSGVYLLRF